jgi:hypothetical protein
VDLLGCFANQAVGIAFREAVLASDADVRPLEQFGIHVESIRRRVEKLPICGSGTGPARDVVTGTTGASGMAQPCAFGAAARV